MQQQACLKKGENKLTEGGVVYEDISCLSQIMRRKEDGTKKQSANNLNSSKEETCAQITGNLALKR